MDKPTTFAETVLRRFYADLGEIQRIHKQGANKHRQTPEEQGEDMLEQIRIMYVELKRLSDHYGFGRLDYNHPKKEQ